MANLSLAIPYDSWSLVIKEVRRVLTPGGRLEFIDDQIFFPYEKPPPSSSPLTIVPKRSSMVNLKASSSTSDCILNQERGSNDVVRKPDLPCPEAEWEERAANSRALESMFQRMLEKNFRIHSRPADFTQNLLQTVFGRENANKSHTFHIALSPADVDSDATAFESPSSTSKKTWMPSIDWDRKEKKREVGTETSHEAWVPASKIPETISAKAAERLGISIPSPDAASSTHLGITTDLSVSRPARVQSPGVILYPSTFIPMSPTELEMHACRHMHVLLGCKSALEKFLFSFKGEDGKPLVGESELEDILWDYQWCLITFPTQHSVLTFSLHSASGGRVSTGRHSLGETPSQRLRQSVMILPLPSPRLFALMVVTIQYSGVLEM
jgi:hypothetical protein